MLYGYLRIDTDTLPATRTPASPYLVFRYPLKFYLPVTITAGDNDMRDIALVESPQNNGLLFLEPAQ